MPENSGFGKQLADALADFVERLESGEDIEVTEVTREETPDGPMHVFRRKKLGGGDDSVSEMGR